MTCIVRYPTKKAFKEAVETNLNNVFIEDPSMFNPYNGTLTGLLERDKQLFVTHPERRWFAQVTRNSEGKVKVK